MSVQPLFFAAARALLRLSELSAAVSGRMNALTVFSISGSAVGSEDSAVFSAVPSAEGAAGSADTGGVQADSGGGSFPRLENYSTSGLPRP